LSSRRQSLRGRLFLYLIGGTTAVLLVGGLALGATLATVLQAEFDRALEAKARALVALTEQDAEGVEFDFRDELMPEFGAGTSPEYFELWLADGSLLARSPSFEASGMARGARLARDTRAAGGRRFQDVRLPDGRRGRQIQIDFVPAPDVADDPGEERAPAPTAQASALPGATLIVARERERLDADVRRLQLGVAAAGVVLMAALAGLTQLALRVGLRSLERLSAQVRQLDVDSLGARVGVERPPEEIAVVVEQINALLDRLEAGFRRERRLSSDIAHELKTPIAELRNLAEVGARWPEDRAAARAFFEDAGAIAQQMERIVVHLLALARYDEGRESVWTAPVRVADAVEAAWKPLAREAVARGVELREDVPPELHVETDPEKFALVLSNLLSNAVVHSPSGATVLCTAREADGRATLSVENPAPNLQQEDLAVMFDRFWRKDEARTGGRNAGLGLALVRAMADLLGLAIQTRLEGDGTFRIALSMPVATGGAVRSEPAARP
jgi:signal transduction histidine kinase